MGDDDLPACLCNIILFATASQRFRNVSRSFVQPGMHGVCLVHGVVGAVHYASKVLLIYYSSCTTTTLTTERIELIKSYFEKLIFFTFRPNFVFGALL